MKCQIILAALTGLAAASPIGAPIAIRANQPLSARQVSDTENELENGACRRITFIFARGSTESGNFGTSVGPPTCQDLKTRYGANNVACQGVGGPYDASLLDNFLPLGTSTAAIGEAERLFNLANTKCPSTIITGGGYSQGGAVISAAIPALSSAVQNKIVGVVLYGDSRNAQDGGRIPNFPAAKTDIICNIGDLICDGTLTVTAAHLAYDGETQAGANFLISKIGN